MTSHRAKSDFRLIFDVRELAFVAEPAFARLRTLAADALRGGLRPGLLPRGGFVVPTRIIPTLPLLGLWTRSGRRFRTRRSWCSHWLGPLAQELIEQRALLHCSQGSIQITFGVGHLATRSSKGAEHPAQAETRSYLLERRFQRRLFAIPKLFYRRASVTL